MTVVVEDDRNPVAQMTELERLENQMTVGYVPTLPIAGMFNTAGMPQMFLRQDTERMLTHPIVRQALGYFKGGIAGATFWGGPNPDNPDDEQGLPICPANPLVGRFIKEQCERFWDRGVPSIQDSYEYGWIGAEQIYEDDEGVLKWKKLFAFAPADTYLLTQDHEPVGIRIKNVQSKSANVDLWFAGENVPAKGLWYAHRPRYNSFYGQSQLIGAWRPWRRLAWIDGAESVIDGAFYRFGYQGPLCRYPDEDLQGPNPGAPNTTPDSQGRPRRFARDIMRQIGEQYKAGATVGLPSKRDDSGNYLYDVTFPTAAFSGIAGMIDYAKYLEDQITEGIGVPPELLEASESGSGYSGRRIPLEAFLANQQHIADMMLQMFVDQVVTPLVLWNFGNVKFNVQVKSLIKTRTKDAQAANAGQPGQGQPPPGAQPNGQPAGQPRPQPPQQGQPPQNPRQMMFSTHAGNERLRALATRLAGSV